MHSSEQHRSSLFLNPGSSVSIFFLFSKSLSISLLKEGNEGIQEKKQTNKEKKTSEQQNN